MLQKGDIGEQPPVLSVTDSMLRANELREGTVVGLDQQVTCSVAFSQGEERRVFFAIHGLPQVPFLTDYLSCGHFQGKWLSCNICCRVSEPAY